MLRINLQPVETANSVKWSRYLLSELVGLARLQPLIIPSRQIPQPQAPQEQAALARPLLWQSNLDPLQWLLDPAKARTEAEHVLAALIQLEAHEPNPHYRDDYREMFIAIRLGLAGDSQPLVSASYRMFGLHPDKVYPAILARREALLGPAGESPTFKEPVLPGSIPSPIKKPVQSTIREEKSDAA